MRFLPMRLCERPGIGYQLPTPQSLRELRERILQAIANVSESQLRRERETFEYRVGVCRKTNGAHMEHLWIDFESLAVFRLFHVCILNRFKNTLISSHRNLL
jgi:hypothetical protein